MTEHDLGESLPDEEAGTAASAVCLRIEGTERLEADAVIRLGGINTADVSANDPVAIAEALKRSGLFKTAKVALDEHGLSVVVSEQPVVNRIVVEGVANAARVIELLGQHGIAPRLLFSPKALAKGEMAIEEMLRDSGLTLVQPVKIVGLKGNRVDLIVTVHQQNVEDQINYDKINSETLPKFKFQQFISHTTHNLGLTDADIALRDAVFKALSHDGMTDASRDDVFQSIRQSLAEKGISLSAGAAAAQVEASRPAHPLPTEAPETYQGLRGPETPPEFVKRVYGPWLGQGLTRADIRKLDPKLSVAITNWLSRPGNEWPADVDLPTKSEQTTRWVERIKEQGVAAAIEGLPAAEALKAANRFRGAMHRRNK